jgi:predicted RNase H-like HicB family nuclease
MEYAVVIEPTSTGFSAYVPDVLGCVAVGETEAEVREMMAEALQFHLEELRLDGDPIPDPVSQIAHVDVPPRAPKFAVIIEKGQTSYGAYVPDLPGCVAVAGTEAEVRKLIREGIEFHLEDMRRDGDTIPAPTSRVDYVTITETASAA